MKYIQCLKVLRLFRVFHSFWNSLLLGYYCSPLQKLWVQGCAEIDETVDLYKFQLAAHMCKSTISCYIAHHHERSTCPQKETTNPPLSVKTIVEWMIDKSKGRIHKEDCLFSCMSTVFYGPTTHGQFGYVFFLSPIVRVVHKYLYFEDPISCSSSCLVTMNANSSFGQWMGGVTFKVNGYLPTVSSSFVIVTKKDHWPPTACFIA